MGKPYDNIYGVIEYNLHKKAYNMCRVKYVYVVKNLQFRKYSKASRYTASRSADLGDARFLIGSQNTWDTRILAKSLEDTRFFIFW